MFIQQKILDETDQVTQEEREDDTKEKEVEEEDKDEQSEEEQEAGFNILLF